jgi:hypothetical protein
MAGLSETSLAQPFNSFPRLAEFSTATRDVAHGFAKAFREIFRGLSAAVDHFADTAKNALAAKWLFPIVWVYVGITFVAGLSAATPYAWLFIPASLLGALSGSPIWALSALRRITSLSIACLGALATAFLSTVGPIPERLGVQLAVLLVLVMARWRMEVRVERYEAEAVDAPQPQEQKEASHITDHPHPQIGQRIGSRIGRSNSVESEFQHRGQERLPV